MRFNTAHCWQCSKPLTFFVSAVLNSRCSVLNVSSFISNKSGGYALKKETVAWTSKLQTFINFNLFIQKKVILHDDFEVFTHPQVGFSSLGPEETQGHQVTWTSPLRRALLRASLACEAVICQTGWWMPKRTEKAVRNLHEYIEECRILQ